MSAAPETLQNVYDRAFAGISRMRGSFTPHLTPREVGTIISVSTGIARVSGLPSAGFEELLEFPGGVFGIAFNVDEGEIGVVLLGEYSHLHAGDEVERTGRVMDVAVGDGLLGRVIDPLGRPLDEGGPVADGGRLPVERPAASIMDRAPVTVPLQTGLKVVDALIPVGRGQRELILGDRRTGKTAIALDTILNQRDRNVVCVYCAIGQRASAVAKVVASLREKGAMDYTVVVVAEGNDAPGLAYIAPYAATSIAEHFMEAGRDVLIVYDDLTHHARAYRELSLLLRRPPGREAFPGDIFYIHSRMLERATHLNKERGGGSLTALPIIETEAQNISAYIPTNLISITDGQIYLSPSLFELGVLPAVDVGKSVSRVGGKAQRAAYRAVAGDLKLAYAQFEELETFARFGARLDEGTHKIIEHGRRIRACLKQPEFSPVPVPAQIAILLALTAELFDPVPLEKMTEAEHAVHEAAAKIPPGICARFETADKLSDEDRAAIIAIATTALAPFQPKPPAKPEPGKKSEVQPAVAAKPGDRAGPMPAKPTATPAAQSGQKAPPKPAEGTSADAPTKARAEPKPASGDRPKAAVAPSPEPSPKPGVKAKEQ
jgi:F-type H+-transporting ATPase subunit alpha